MGSPWLSSAPRESTTKIGAYTFEKNRTSSLQEEEN